MRRFLLNRLSRALALFIARELGHMAEARRTESRY